MKKMLRHVLYSASMRRDLTLEFQIRHARAKVAVQPDADALEDLVLLLMRYAQVRSASARSRDRYPTSVGTDLWCLLGDHLGLLGREVALGD